MRKRTRIILVIVIVLASIIWFNYPKLNIISGYASKNLASNVYIAHRTEQAVVDNDNDIPLIKYADENYDTSKKTAYADVFGLMKRETICRDGLGCVLINETFDKNKKWPKPLRVKLKNDLPFPFGENEQEDTVFASVDYQQLNKAMLKVFENNQIQQTRTVFVVYKGQIVAEKYADGFSKDTPILGWSMTKSVLATLFGILEYQEKIDLNEAPFWNGGKNNTLGAITYNHFLRMQSGMAWDEDYASISDVTRMLFLEADMTKAQVQNDLIAAPTEIWNYSSGTTNLLSGLLRSEFKSYQEYLDFPYAALIDKIGMNSMLLETDMAGNFVGSSYGWATTRDWAKFGLLHLYNGNWNGVQLFSPDWIDYITKPTKNSKGTYGAHWWLNAEGKYPDVPTDLYSANGFQGQRVFVIPSKDLVIVRTGLAGSPDFDESTFLKELVQAFK